MSEKTGISWCDATFNPWWGCQKVSPACDHCYAERDAKRFASDKVLWGAGSERRTFDDEHWDKPGKWNAVPWLECLDCGNRYGARSKANRHAEFATCGHCGSQRAKISRRRVFCASMADWLDLDAPLDEFVRLLETIRTTPELDWLLLTKRIGNWRKRLDEAMESIADEGPTFLGVAAFIELWRRGQPPANVWLGATVIDQAEADRDIPKLLAVPARVRFLSIEPMLGRVDLGKWLWECCGEFQPGNDHGALGQEPDHCCGRPQPKDAIAWIIAGGESGPHARPAHPAWFRSLRDQCAAAGVPFHFKQHGEWLPTAFCDDDAAMLPIKRTVYVKPDGSYVPLGEGVDFFHGAEETAWVGKAAAGRLLDGVAHDEFPA